MEALYDWFNCSSEWQPVGRNCSCVWLFWRTVLYSSYQRRGVGTGCVQSVKDLQWCFLPVSWLLTCISPEWRAGWHQWLFPQSWPLQSVPVLFCGQSKPESDGCAENGLDYDRVKLDQQLLKQVELPELAQEVHPLLGLFDDCVDVGCPTWVIVNPRKRKVSITDTMLLSVVMGCGGSPPEVHCHPHNFECVKLQVVLTAPEG